MKIKENSPNNIMVLISSVVLFILGAIIYSNPNEVMLVVTYVIGGLIILYGVFSCVRNYIEIKKDNKTSSKGMVLGIVLIIIGLIFIFLGGVIETLIRFIIGGWILICGITRLANALSLEKKNTNFYVLLILSLLLIGGGLYTVLKTNLAFKAIGLILMIYSILEIFSYVFNRKENIEFNSKKESNDNEEDNDTKVKEADVINESNLDGIKEQPKKAKTSKKKKESKNSRKK